MEIRKTRPENADFGLFEAVPQQVGPPDDLRQDPLNSELLQECFVAFSGGVPVGRLALYDNPALHFRGRKAACFGNYVCADDPQVARELLEAALVASKDRGFGCVLVPLNGSIWHDRGLAPVRRLPVSFSAVSRQPHHDAQFKAAGFFPVKESATFIDTDMRCADLQLLAREAEFLERGVLIRSIRTGMLGEELEMLHPFVDLAFRSDILYTPIAAEAFRDRFLHLSADIDPEMVLVAQDSDGCVIGFIFGLPDPRSRNDRQLVIDTLAAHPDERWSGIDAVLLHRAIAYAGQCGYTSVFYPAGGLWQRSTGVACGNEVLYCRVL